VKRTGQIPFMGLKIGIFVFIACALLLWATFQSGSFRLGKEEEIVVRFPSVGGLEEGAVVRLNGVPVGVVRDISLTPERNDVAVKLGVKRGTKARLHEGASARITTVGFLAELYVELNGGNEAGPLIRSDAEITPGLLADPAVMMNKVKSMADTLDIMLSNLTSASRSLAQGKGTLGQLSKDDRLYEQMVSLTREATQLTSRMNANQERISARLYSLTTTLDSLTYQMQHGNGTVARLLNSDELHQKLASSSARLDSILAIVESGKGTFGRMMADTALFDDTKALVASMKRLMAEIEKNPKKYLKFSVF
jgi:phospholipid/cholesterol/gamma-HCH transport system substrate-binding protein